MPVDASLSDIRDQVSSVYNAHGSFFFFVGGGEGVALSC